MELTGRYVVLRPLGVEDAETTLRWRLSERALLLNRGATTVAEQAAWITSRPDTEFNFVIQLHSGEPVGMLSLVNIDLTHRRAEPARLASSCSWSPTSERPTASLPTRGV